MPFLRLLARCLGLASVFGVTLHAQTYTPYHFTTVASGYYGGSVDGPAATAQFNGPTATAVDAQGNLFVADRDNHTIRQITPDGVATTLAGWAGHAGSADGQGTSARFNRPSGVALDRVGNIVVADSGNRTIRRVTRQGVVTTIAGAANLPDTEAVDGSGADARFVNPVALIADRAGNIYVADSRAPVTFLFNSETGKYDQSHFYSSVRKIAPDGVVSTVVGKRGIVPATPPAAQTSADLMLSYVNCLALDASGTLYLGVGTSGEYVLWIVVPNGPIRSATVVGGLIAGVAVDAGGNVFWSDASTQRIRKRSPDDTQSVYAGSGDGVGYGISNVDGPGDSARFYYPAGLAFDANGRLLVADTSNNSIRRITPDRIVSTVAGGKSRNPTIDSLLTYVPNSSTFGVSGDAQGNLYFSTGITIEKLGTDGSLVTLAGTAGEQGFTDGTGADARFKAISAYTADSNGDVYVIDHYTLRKITAGGVVTTLAGDPTQAGFADGMGNAARFDHSTSLTIDAAGNIYVADTPNYAVRKVTPAGLVTTLAGSGTYQPKIDGSGSAAGFSRPSAITCDRTTGKLFVIDNGTLREITPDGTVTTSPLGASLGVIFTGQMSTDSTGNLVVASNLSLSGGVRSVLTTGPNPPPQPYAAQIWQITPSGTATLLGGSLTESDYADGTGAGALFGDAIDAVTVAGDAHIFVRYHDNSVLSAGTPNRAPVATTASCTTPSNQTATFTLPASDPDGDALTYSITATTGGTATVAGNLATFTPAPGATGPGSVSFNASDGYATSGTGSVNIAITPAVTLLANISTRGRVGAGDNVLIAGFVLTGPANTPKTVLVRAAGPALAAQGVGRPLSRPVITLMQGSFALASNQAWGTAGNAADIATASAKVSAFAFAPGSNDSAVLTQLLPGVYSAVVSGVEGDGVALAEVYDGEIRNPAHHPVNVSSRGFVGTGDDVLIAGFIVNGTSPQKFLIRAVGPGLSAVSGLGGLLADPQFHLYQGPVVIKHVVGWTNDTEMQKATSQTGAFPLPVGSTDAAAIVTLDPGNYTAIVSSQSGASGLALVEVYQLL